MPKPTGYASRLPAHNIVFDRLIIGGLCLNSGNQDAATSAEFEVDTQVNHTEIGANHKIWISRTPCLLEAQPQPGVKSAPDRKVCRYGRQPHS